MSQSYLALGRHAEARDALTAAVASAERLGDEAEQRRSSRLLGQLQ